MRIGMVYTRRHALPIIHTVLNGVSVVGLLSSTRKDLNECFGICARAR